MESMYVQYGCGFVAPEEWENYDSSLTLRFERIPFIGRLYTKNEKKFPRNVKFGDIVRGLPVPDMSCRGVYCSHILEHLALDELRVALLNTHKILAPGGEFRLVVPDLRAAAADYLADNSRHAVQRFMHRISMGQERRQHGLYQFLKRYLGSSEHRWMWDEASLKSELEHVGFGRVRRAVVGDAIDPLFSKVEDITRWEGCLGMSCIRPEL